MLKAYTSQTKEKTKKFCELEDDMVNMIPHSHSDFDEYYDDVKDEMFKIMQGKKV